MTLDERARLSYYEKITSLNDIHGVWLVKNKENNRIYVWKELEVYTIDVYIFLKQSKSKYFPEIIDFVEIENGLILIEEYINGRTLDEFVNENGVFEYNYATNIMINLCDALSVIHNAKPAIINRDIKPSNIMITNEGAIKLVDFNIARVYDIQKQDDTMLLGSSDYAAPEQYGYRQSDIRTDIFALGNLYNYLLTGKLPKEELTHTAALNVINKCIMLEPNMRYQNVNQLKSALIKYKENNGFFRNNYITYNNINSQSKLKNKGEFWCLNKYKDNRQMYLPGFRRGNVFNRVCGIAGYLFVLYCVIDIKTTGVRDTYILTFVDNLFMKIIIFGWLMFIIFYVTNYLNLRSQLPVFMRENKYIFKISGIIWCFVVLFIMMCSYAIIENFLEIIIK